MNKLLIVGAGGHGRVVADIARLSPKYDEIAFVDDADINYSGGIKVVGRINDIDTWLMDSSFIVAIGNNHTRSRIMTMLEAKGAKLTSLIHPSAVIADGVKIGLGSAVMANAVINCGSRIGKGVIINTAATVDHDNEISNFVHISPGVHLAGNVQVGELTWVGIGVNICNNVSVCGGCTIGAGAAVIDNIDIKGTYIGVPAKWRG